MITVNAKALAGALSVQGKIVSKKSSMPVLQAVRLEAKDGTLQIHGTDMTTHLVLTIPCTGSGAVCVSRSELAKAIKKAKGNVEIDAQDARVRVITNAGVSSLDGIPVEDFPSIPEIKADPEIVPFDESFRDALEYILPAISTDVTKAALNNVCLQKGRCVSTDGHRLHLVSGDTLPSFSEEVLLPRSLVTTFLALKADRGIVAYVPAEKRVVIKGTGFEITSRVDDSKFPNIDQVIPKEESPIVFKIGTDATDVLLRAIDGEREGVTLEADESMVVKTTEGAFTGNVPIEKVRGEKGVIGINARYLVEAMAGEGVTLGISDEYTAMTVRNGNKFALIMPCRL